MVDGTLEFFSSHQEQEPGAHPMSTPSKTLQPVDGNMEIELLRRRYHQLRGYAQNAKREMDEISAKLGAKMDEVGADVLTIGGESVIQKIDYTRDVVKLDDLRTLYPNVFHVLARQIPVRRVDIR